MSLPTSRLAYEDCLDAMDRALEDPKGIRIRVPDRDAAHVLRQRMHQARVLDRNANRLKYPEEGHAMHGCSVYDRLRATIRRTKAGTFLYLEQINLDQNGIEDLSKIEDDPTIAPEAGDPAVLAAVVEAAKRRA
jgi:hypothetical protein